MYTHPFRTQHRLPAPPPKRTYSQGDYLDLPYINTLAALVNGDSTEARRWLTIIAAMRKLGFRATDGT